MGDTLLNSLTKKATIVIVIITWSVAKTRTEIRFDTNKFSYKHFNRLYVTEL